MSKITIDETNPHYKFAKYWEAIGRPDLEVDYEDDNEWHDCVSNPNWFPSKEYRIKGDRHWQLRKEWVDSDFTLPIEYQINKTQWWLLSNDVTKNCNYVFSDTVNYRKAETKQETIMTETKELPTLVEGKKLEKVDVPISTLPECLLALSAGYVLESGNGFHYINDNSFICAAESFSNNEPFIKSTGDDFYFQPFIAVYKLVDVPWWENIPDGGVLCEVLVGQSAVIPDGIIFLEVVSGVSYDGYAKFQRDIYIGKSNIEISKCKPVTDKWLESMKRGF